MDDGSQSMHISRHSVQAKRDTESSGVKCPTFSTVIAVKTGIHFDFKSIFSLC
jgi:hypothetical protein